MVPSTIEGATRTVFIAPVSVGMQELVRKVQSDLEMRGVGVVLPEGTAADWGSSVRNGLSRATLSIHLIGDTDQRDSTQSRQRISDALAAAIEYSRTNPALQVLVWRPRHSEEASGQLPILDLIGKHPELSATTEVVQSTVEDLKSMIYDKLESQPGPSEATPVVAALGSGVQLYLIYDQRDSETAQPVVDFLKQHEITVLPSIFEGEQAALRAMHNEYLRRCDAAVIIYGKVREPWVRMKQQDLLRSAALGRPKRLAAKAVFLCSNNKEEKAHFSAPDMTVIKGFESTDALSSFVEKLGAAVA